MAEEKLNWSKMASAIKWIFDRGGDLGGVMNLFGLGPGRRTAPVAEEPKQTSSGKPIEVNSWGAQDEEGILYLLAKYGIPPEVLKEGLEPIPVTLEETRALGRMVGAMSPGQADAFKHIIARGNEQPITVKVPVPIKLEKKDPKTGNVSYVEKEGYREYTVFAALRGSHILRSIGQDILRSGDEAAQSTRAVELVSEFERVGILKNWQDMAKKVWSKLDDIGSLPKVDPRLWHDLHRIANCLGGWQPVRTMLGQPIGHRLWQAYLEAKPEEASLRRDALIDHLSREAQLIQRLPKKRQQREWGIKPIRSRYWWRFYFCVVVAAIVALIWAMYPTHPV